MVLSLQPQKLKEPPKSKPISASNKADGAVVATPKLKPPPKSTAFAELRVKDFEECPATWNDQEKQASAKPDCEEGYEKKEQEELEDDGPRAKKTSRSNLETHARDNHKGKSYKPDSGSEATLGRKTGDKSDGEGSVTKDDRDFIAEEDEESTWNGKNKDGESSTKFPSERVPEVVTSRIRQSRASI